MSGPTRTLVPLAEGGAADVGLVAASLVYCERVTVLVETPEHLATLVDWFVAPGEIETLILWLRDGVVEWVSSREDFRSGVLEHPLIAKLLHGQWRHSRFLKYGGVHAVRVATAGSPVTIEAARALGSDLLLPAEVIGQAVAELQRIDECDVRSRTIRVGIPNLRAAVNQRRADLRDLLHLRRAATPLRQTRFAASVGGETGLSVAEAACGEWNPLIVGV